MMHAHSFTEPLAMFPLPDRTPALASGAVLQAGLGHVDDGGLSEIHEYLGEPVPAYHAMQSLQNQIEEVL